VTVHSEIGRQLIIDAGLLLLLSARVGDVLERSVEGCQIVGAAVPERAFVLQALRGELRQGLAGIRLVTSGERILFGLILLAALVGAYSLASGVISI